MKYFLTIPAVLVLMCGLVFAADNVKPAQLEEIVVTGSREAEPLKEKPMTVGVIKGKEIENVKPAHPSEIMNRIPGVWISTTAGEGHQTAIRQPLTTNPVYLYLEDGIPIRSTGFFNHNALYEINIPGADRIEVIKGPGTALYGSDAIGGTINVLTRPSPLKPEFEINPEGGSYGWYRLLASGGGTWGSNGLRLALNVTHSDGWRERNGYDRQSVTLRWDRLLGANARAKTIISFSDIDQKTGGASGLLRSDFESRPWYNYNTFDFRKVKAFRVSTEVEKEFGEDILVSVTPYVRWNEMNLLPGWGIFPAGNNIYFGYNSTTRFYSLGLLAKYRQDFKPWNTRLIGGVDIDYSPGTYFERRIQVTRDGNNKYVSYTYVASTANNFDYDATFTGISPYVQVETSPVEKLRLTAGARYDNLSYDYETRLDPNANRPANTTRSFSHLSPKAGLTYAFTKDISGFVSYNNAFRVPSSDNLFRGTNGSAATAIALRPIKVDSYEGGLKGGFAEFLAWSASYYYMEKRDDLVNFSVTTNLSEKRNAAKTEHRGIELGVSVKPVKEVELSSSYSNAVHKYKDYRVSNTSDFSGKEIPQAPRTIVNTRLDYKPAFMNGGLFELEWVKLGSYWLDDANTEKYGGHDVYNARASYFISKQWEIYAKLINFTDKLYAESASKSGSNPAQFAPGAPRTFYAGVVYRWGGK